MCQVYGGDFDAWASLTPGERVDVLAMYQCRVPKSKRNSRDAFAEAAKRAHAAEYMRANGSSEEGIAAFLASWKS